MKLRKYRIFKNYWHLFVIGASCLTTFSFAMYRISANGQSEVSKVATIQYEIVDANIPQMSLESNTSANFSFGIRNSKDSKVSETSFNCSVILTFGEDLRGLLEENYLKIESFKVNGVTKTDPTPSNFNKTYTFENVYTFTALQEETISVNGSIKMQGGICCNISNSQFIVNVKMTQLN